MDKKNIFKNVLLFLVTFLSINLIFKSCQPSEKQVSMLDQGSVGFMTTETTYGRNSIVTVEIKNNTGKDIVIPQECPEEPFRVLHYENGEWVQISAKPELDCSKAVAYTLKPAETAKIPYDNWNYALFSRMGKFKIAFDTEIPNKDGILEKKIFETNEFLVDEEGLLSKLWTGVLYRPIYNILIFLVSIMPGHNLGLAIIILTIIVRTILLIPSQKAMKAQKKMQNVQPMIESIKEKYKGDQQKIAQETMAIWKTQKVNPLGSCLPLLLQFPFLIALFYVVKEGLNPDNAHLFYTTYSNFSFSNIDTSFLGLDLLKNNIYVLPVIIGLLTFAQTKLSIHRSGKKKDGKSGGKEIAIANNMMVYFMPVMIAVFAASLPAAVGVYWGVSTLYGVVQQLFVNKSGTKPKEEDSDVKVRVIEPKEDKPTT
jgi:YidC/Oxa1 family membrane protein insertase